MRNTASGFQTAALIFNGPVFTAIDDRFDYGEIRQNSIGAIKGVAIIVLSHTERNGRTRIISARPAKKQERDRYAKALHQRTEP
ncbi:BrnT family toxin [Xaviernesmea rhizosphaerae]|uniref:BrnT family toxin n=1 Tax=Xaviernesmea rhizosphaerae TaxID=1672749 RepID=UPI003CC97984